MGVDCKIYLPARVRIDNIADVIGALLGNAVEKRPLGRDSYHAFVANTTTVPSSVTSCANIRTMHRGKHRAFLYHFEFHRDGGRGIMSRSTAENIALLRGLADFFGGRVDYQDCDDCECDYFVDEQPDIHAEDGDEWERLQNRILAVQPISDASVTICREFAAYKEVA